MATRKAELEGRAAAPRRSRRQQRTDPTAQAQSAPTQVDSQLAGFSPAMAQANTTIATTHALANLAHNASEAQQQSDIQLHSSTIQGLQSLLDNPVYPHTP